MKIPREITMPKLYRLNPRIAFAIGLLGLSLMAALAITSQANRSVLVWSAKGDLAVGDVIVTSDLISTKVLLPENSFKYLSNKAKLTGSVVVRRVGSGELIPAAALSRGAHATDIRSVPFKVAKSDLPNDLAAGQLIDLYILPLREVTSGKILETQMLAHGVSVESIDIKARDIGGDIGVVLKLPDSAVLNILGSLTGARIVLVRSAI
ncbi:MAG: hypothetical protein NTZ31_02110 [Actinobacteria bacterium]|jgi:hypothetical protein|nr:hypothetical protein [Actinomycetota bacterium]